MYSKGLSPAALAYASTQSIGMTETSPNSFAGLIQQSLQGTARYGAQADQVTAAAAAGKRPDVVDVVTAVAESEAALETLVAVRDKVIQAYEEIMRMPI